MTASWARPVDGAGTWRHTPSHGLRLTLLGTFAVCLLLTLAFLIVLAIGRQAMCTTHHNQLRYCPGYTSNSGATP